MKKILILFCILLLTGCTANYNVDIDENLRVLESTKIVGSEELYSAYYKTSRNKVLKGLLEIYSTDLEKNNYEYHLVKGENPYINLKKSYDNISNYLNNSLLFNDYFDKIDYNKNGNIIKIETIGFNPNVLDDPERFYVNNLDIAIKCAYKVVNHNANKVDERTNTYHFIMDENTDDFKILFEFDSSRKFNPYLKMINVIIIIILLIILSWVIIYITNKRKKNKV